VAFIVDPKSVSFPQILADLEEFRDSRPDADKWNSFFQSGTGQTITEQIAALGAYLAYKVISGRRENYLQHAENKSSAVGISQSLGYSTFRGRNAHLRLSVVASDTVTLPRFSVVGQVKDQDLVILEDTPLTANVSAEVDVVVGVLSEEELTVPGNGLAIFRFESAGVTEDLRLLLNDDEVEISNRILDLDEDKFVCITNVLESVDVSYLNRASAPVQYNTGDVLKIEYLAKKDLAFVLSDLNFFHGTISGFETTSAYQAAEGNATTRVNAPLFHETQALVRARLDFLKVFKIIDPDFVSTNQRNVSAAVVELSYLNSDYTALTETEKQAVQQQLLKRLAMGIPPPLITDPVRVPLMLDLEVTLRNNTENTLAEIEAIMKARENILGGPVNGEPLDLEQVESDVEDLASVKIARVSLGSTQWAAENSYERGTHVRPNPSNGFFYELASILHFSGSSEPDSWPTTIGETVVDHGVVWKAEFVNPADPLVTTWVANRAYEIGNAVVPTVPNGRQYRVVDTINKSFGNEEVQHVGFDVVPDGGTWRLHYDDGNHGPQRTIDLPFDATAEDIENALNAMECLDDVVVTGDYVTGFTITFAGADAHKQQPQLTTDDPGLDEIQLVSFDQVPNSGSFGLDFDGEVTDPIPFTANAAAVKAALEALPNIDLVDVSGDFTNGFSVTFRGVNAKQPVPQLVQALLASSGVDEVQTISFGSVPDGGTWRLHFGGEYTADMAYNASLTDIQTQLNGLSALSSVVVTGSYAGGIVVTFQGADGKKVQGSLSASSLGANSIQKVTFSQIPDFGTWILDYNGQKTSALQFNATASAVQAALNALPGLSSVVVTGDYSAGFTVEFDGADGLQPQYLLDSGDPGEDEVQTITFTSVPDRGSFTLDFDGEETDALLPTSTAADVEAALEALDNVDDVSVTGNFDDGFEVTFLGQNAKSDVALLTVASNSLVDDQVAEQWSITTIANTANVLHQKTFYLHDDVGSVAFWIDSGNTGVIEPVEAISADRSVRITTIVSGDSALNVAIKVRAAINSDSKFSASNLSNVITIVSDTLGARTDASAETSGFTISTTVQGVTAAVTPSVAETNPGVEPDNQLVKADNSVVIVVAELQAGLLPANSLLDGVDPVSISIVETTPGEDPVSNLERSSVPVDVVITTTAEGQYPANALTSSGGPVVVGVTTVLDAADAEPTWPTALGARQYDGDILWLAVPFNGTPDEWQPGTNYRVGDFVQPTEEVLDAETEELLMFQCIGFIGTSGGSQPSFPVTLGATVTDNNCLWKARDPDANPAALSFREYYDVIQSVTLKGP
jgi:hypothetical protein